MFACNLLTNKNIWSWIMQKYNLCKIITLMLEGATKATCTAKAHNSLVIYLIHVIQTLPQTPTQSHSCNFPWCCCTAMDPWHRKALVTPCVLSPGHVPHILTRQAAHRLWLRPWHGWTLSNHGQELLLRLRFQFRSFCSTEETRHLCHRHM